MNSCPVCSSDDVDELLDLGEAAVFCNVQWPSRTEALGAPKGAIRLASCVRCGHVFNNAFNSCFVDYAPGYENSQHASTVFADYAQRLVNRLINTYAVSKRPVIDIGCGSGELLRMLALTAGTDGYGFDPSCVALQETINGQSVFRLLNENFSVEHARELEPELVCCRHVLEHISTPITFLTELRQALSAAGRSVLYLEVPNGNYMFERAGVWDVLYEHVSYFSRDSIELALLVSGFEILRIEEEFGGQFLCVDACVSVSDHKDRIAELQDMDDGPLDTDVARMRERIEDWRMWAGEQNFLENRTSIWGAGTKGVMFLNLLGISSDRGIEYVIDQNPKKSSLYVSCTGQRIRLPELELLRSLDQIVLMNSIYRSEIESQLLASGSTVKLLAADQ